MKFAYKAIAICLVGVMCVSAYHILEICLEYNKARTEYNKIREVAFEDGEIDWEALHKINSDIVAWISLEDSNINYPVVKGGDNDFYLHRNAKKEQDSAGTPFIDCRIENEFEEFDTIIYGHNMKDGSMFSGLTKYIEKEDFYETHKQIELITQEGKYNIVVFAGFYTKAGSEIYDDEYVREHIEEIANLGEVEVTPEDKIVTLSTCAYVYEDARCVIIGKLEPERRKQWIETN